MKNIKFLKKYFFTILIFAGIFVFAYLLLLVPSTTSAFSTWPYSPQFNLQGPLFSRMYPPSIYSPMFSPRINSPWSYPNTSFQPLSYGQSSLFNNWQNPFTPWGLQANHQFSSGGLQNSFINLGTPGPFSFQNPWASNSYSQGYQPGRYSASSGPNSFFNEFSILGAFPLWPSSPPTIARTAAVTSPPPPAGPPAPLGIDTSQILYKPPAFQSLGVSYVPGQPAYVGGQVVATFRPGVPPVEINKVYAVHQCRELYSSPYAGFKILSVPTFVTVKNMCQKLSLEPSILSVSPNYYRHAHQIITPDDTYYNYQWHLPRLNCGWAWNYSTGAGALVGLLDSGVAYQTSGVYAKAPDLAGTLFVPGQDFINLDAYPDDDYGHGTHMAGCIAQTTFNAFGVAGVAYNATIMPVKIMDNTGSTPISNEVEGIYFATNNGVNIINMSLGGTGVAASEQDAVTYAYSNGVTVVCSAGNAGSSVPEYPASYTECLSVSALRYDYRIPSYSNYGAYIDVCAPGGDLSVDQNLDNFGDGILQQTHNGSNFSTFYYYFMEGTSPACALVSGVAALIISKSTIPLTPLQVTDILKGSATDLGAAGWDEYYGNGLVNAYLAVVQTP